MNSIVITLAAQTEQSFATQLVKHLDATTEYSFAWEIDEDNEMDSSREWRIGFDDEFEYSEQIQIEDLVQTAMEDVAAAQS